MSIVDVRTTDDFTGQYADEATFIASVCGRLELFLRERGHSHAALVDIDWTDAKGGRPARATIVARPKGAGGRPLTVDACRQLLREKAHEARRLELTTGPLFGR